MEGPLSDNPLPKPYNALPRRYVPYEQLGRSIDQFPPASGAGGGNVTYNFTPPLWLYKVSTTTLAITFGQVSGITPSGGWAGGGNDVGVAVNIASYTAATYNIYFDASVGATTGAVTACTVTATSAAVPASTSTHAYLLCGQAGISGGVVNTVSPSNAWSQNFVACTAGDPNTYHWQVA